MRPTVPQVMNKGETIASLIATLHATERQLEILTSGQVDSVADSSGHQYLLRHAQERLRDAESTKRAALLEEAEEAIRQVTTVLERRGAERTAKLEFANKELEAFNHSVSHDLRAPLRHIVAFASLLQQRLGSSLAAEDLRRLTAIVDSANKMAVLIDDLMAFARVGSVELRKVDVDMDELIRDALTDFAAESSERKVIWTLHSVARVQGDHALLRMVLVNLISNALKFTQGRPQARIEIGAGRRTDQQTVVYIRDNGVGFDAKYADKLFGVFQRLHSQAEFAGTGIGLANVKSIVQRHGGRTWAEGAVDQGATFYFSLPASAII